MPSHPVTARGGHVLVVDEDERILAVAKATLEQEGFEVTIASDGSAARRIVAEKLPDLIVSDVMMPDVDGFSLVEHLRENPRTRTIPLAFLVAEGGPGDIGDVLDLSAGDYITKPLRPEELVACVRASIAQRPVPEERLENPARTGVVSAHVLRAELRREMSRAARAGRPGVLALVELNELRAVHSRLGNRVMDAVTLHFAEITAQRLQPLDVVGRFDRWRFAILIPEISEDEAQRRLDDLARRLVKTSFEAPGEVLRFTPTVGFAAFKGDDDPAQVERRAALALRHSVSRLEVRAARFEPPMLADAVPAKRRRTRARERLATPLQVLATLFIGVAIPFLVYWALDSAGFDITWPMYLLVVATLLITALMILIEGLMALGRPAPPEQPGAPAPPASAIIAAYLPNEAATVIETVKAFLAVDYEPGLEVILAYNAPNTLQVEDELREIATRDPRLVLFRVKGSSSKAQNVNAALSKVTGEFVGLFDADHHPEAGAYHRAWRWLSSGYDVVQGHCVVRNGDASWVARTVAVEFEAIYAVSHPGRARFHDFGIFGGTNGYWRTDLLRELRLRGSMLTEDIDASMRVIERGGRIASDPDLLSRELAPATLGALWNQRMRWAQGWHQVSRRHLWRGLRSNKLSVRQKIGLFYLLGWREIYPWISLQMFPIIGYWIVKFGGADALNWLIPLFVATTVFTLGTGPAQTFFAYRLSAPEIRRRRWWFVWYFVVGSAFYTEFKNIVGRVAQLKELVGERKWTVTTRRL